MSDDDSAGPEATARREGSGASPRAGTAVQDGDESRADAATGSGGMGSAAPDSAAPDSAAKDSAAKDSATTTSLPAVGGHGDPYLDRSGRATRGSAAIPAVGPRPSAASPSPAATGPTPGGPLAGPSSPPSMPPPSMPPMSAPPRPPSGRPAVPSAVDQYAALGLGGTVGTDTTSVTAAAPSAPAPPAAPIVATSTARRPRGQRTPRRARLQLRHFNVWTVFKFSVVLAVALFFVWLIIVAVLYGTLDHLQAIDKVNKTVRTIENDSSTNDAVTPRIVFTAAFLIGLVNIVLFIALTTIGAVVYNLCADLVGGIEVTLAERD